MANDLVIEETPPKYELELSEAVSNSIAALPEIYRPVLNLHIRNGLNAREIAKGYSDTHVRRASVVRPGAVARPAAGGP